MSVTLGQAELAELAAIARAAGDAIMQVYAGPAHARIKPDGSPVTDADLRADDIACAGLARAFPGIPRVSEESGLQGSALAGTYFLVDALDGTKEFLQRTGQFTVNLGLVVDGVPVAGVVLAPAIDECYWAASGLGAWQAAPAGAVRLHVQPCRNGAPVRVVGSRSHGTDALQACLDALPVPHAFTPAGSSLKFCRIAQGAADAYPRFGTTRQWDTAAAQCVLEAAGGCVLDPQGAPLRYGMDRPIENPHFFALADPAFFPWFQPAPRQGRHAAHAPPA